MAKASESPPRFCDPDAGVLSPEAFSAACSGNADFAVFESSVKEIGFEENDRFCENRGVRLRVWFDGASEWKCVFLKEDEIIREDGGGLMSLVGWQASHGLSLGVRDGQVVWLAKDKSSARLAPYHHGLGEHQMIIFARWLGLLMLSHGVLREKFGQSVHPEASLRIRFPKEYIDAARVMEEKEDLERAAAEGKALGGLKKRL